VERAIRAAWLGQHCLAVIFLQYMQFAKRYGAGTLDLYSGVATAITAGSLKAFCGFTQ